MMFSIRDRAALAQVNNDAMKAAIKDDAVQGELVNELQPSAMSVSAQLASVTATPAGTPIPADVTAFLRAQFDALMWSFYHHNEGLTIFSWHWWFISVSYHLRDVHALFVTLFGAEPVASVPAAPAAPVASM